MTPDTPNPEKELGANDRGETEIRDTVAQARFFEEALSSAGEWARFADPKVLGTFVFLGLGSADLVSRAYELVHAHSEGNLGGWIATVAFVAACGLAGATVLCASFSLFPRLNPQSGLPADSRSLYYFGGIAAHPDPASYEHAVRSKSQRELETEIARQAWEVSRIASAKHLWSRRAYVVVIGFLVCWATARVALSFVS